MRLLINTVTLKSSGGVQVSISFLEECRKVPANEYFVFLGSGVASQIATDTFPNNFHFYEFSHHPLYGIKGYITKKKIKKTEREIKPDCVFSVFGPSCWRPNSPHLQGFANGYHIYLDSPLFIRFSFYQAFFNKIHRCLYKFFLKKSGDYFVCETIDATYRLKQYLGIIENVFTVSNTYSNYYDIPVNHDRILPIKCDKEFRLLSLCGYAIHKNLEIINEIVLILKSNYPELRVKFIVTLKDTDFDKCFDEKIVKDYVYNIGVQKIVDCPKLYSEVDALFLPTLVECFSANYPEAMKMGKVILTSDLSFAHEICEDAAMYFDPLNAQNICDSILRLYTNIELRESIINKGYKQLKKFPTASERAFQYLKICEEISIK